MTKTFQAYLSTAFLSVSCLNADIYCAHWKVGEFANAEGGRFASEPAQVTIEKLEPGRVGCKDAPSAKAKPQLSSGSSISERKWENWKDDDVTEVIHHFWIQSQSELNHRKVLAQLVNRIYFPGERFLEAGCGSGLVYKELIPGVMNNQHYTGIDVTQNMLDIAHRDYPNGTFLRDDLYNLSFEDDSFDVVAAFEVLGHIRDIQIPIKEMLRVASRMVVFTVWTSDSTFVTEERFRNSRFIHTAFSHADIMNAIGNYTVETIPLNEHTTAYIITIPSTHGE